LTYPSLTQDLHHEAELVVAIGTGGRDILAKDAASHIFGFASGNDLTAAICKPMQNHNAALGICPKPLMRAL
jgi:2-keto-4-pentenoate hydratase/2-oxohepta-3-ene-1,7-dioic acid hydratase in catechol pathway